MKGKSTIHPKVHIRGDFSNIRIGRYCSIGRDTIIRPPSYQTNLKSDGNVIQFLPLLIGNHTRIGSNCVIESASIGSCVHIAHNVVISKRVIIKDCCYIEEGTVIPADTVIPPFSRVRGCPGNIVVGDPYLDIPESVATTFVEECIDEFTHFVDSLEKSK